MVIMTPFAFITGWIHVNHPVINMKDKLRNVGLFGSDGFLRVSKSLTPKVINEGGDLEGK